MNKFGEREKVKCYTMATCSKKARLNSTDINEILNEFASDDGEFLSDEHMLNICDMTSEASDAENMGYIEANEDSYDSDESEEFEEITELCGKDGTRWRLDPYPEYQLTEMCYGNVEVLLQV